MKLNELFFNGDFHGLSIGISSNEVLSKMGKPFSVYEFEKDLGYIYTYQDFELTVWNQKLTSVKLYFGEEFNLFLEVHNKVVQVDSNFTLINAIEFLKKLQIDWSFNKLLCFHKQIGITTIGGVNLIFDFDEQFHGSLRNLNVS